MLPRHARCVLSRLRCNGHSLLLGSYLSRIGRIENPSCSACEHSSQDVSHLILHCPATDSLRRSLFGDSLSLYDLWSRPWGVARLLGLHGLPPCPHPSEGVGQPTTTGMGTNSLWTPSACLKSPTNISSLSPKAFFFVWRGKSSASFFFVGSDASCGGIRAASSIVVRQISHPSRCPMYGAR